MKPVTVVAAYSPQPLFERMLRALAASPLVQRIIITGGGDTHVGIEGCQVLTAGGLASGQALNAILNEIRTAYLLLLPGPNTVSLDVSGLEKKILAADSTKAGMVYSDFYESCGSGKSLHPLNDYQPGSVRDDFDFGKAILFSTAALRRAVGKYGCIPPVRFAGLYDLRLKVSIDHTIYHFNEAVYSIDTIREDSEGEKLFAYVDPRNAAVQKEMETVFTDYLNRIGAYLPPDYFKEAEAQRTAFPVEASVIIPVRNRKGTVADAVKSALSQDASFSFNVIVVDNHSTDGTTDVLSTLARRTSALRHLIPARTDLGIGGCWNEAVTSEVCGRYAVQLDSDDLYGSSKSLQKIVDMLRTGGYGMVIGSYTVVDFDLKETPPGLVDHREWTDTNGRNNALRINGLGAPRAFETAILRAVGFLNVSYGEDYAASLRICREYRIGRIYESLYLCRRWSGNTDAALTIERTNRNDAFKDSIRTDEIRARQKMNRERSGTRT